MKSARQLAILGIILLCLAAPMEALADANLLANPSFEGGSTMWVDPWGNRVPEVQLPNGWPLLAFEPNCGAGCMHRPETKLEDGTIYGLYRIKDGYKSWKAFTTYSTHRFWLGQQVRVPYGTALEFSAWAMAWSSAFSNPYQSDQGSYRTRIGIDPLGGTDPSAASVVWSHPAPGFKVMDVFYQHRVRATAQSSVVTVWLQGDAEWALKHNDSYWDAASLTAMDDPYPLPTEQPTPTPRPDPTPTAQPTTFYPEPTPEPTANYPAIPDSSAPCWMLPVLRAWIESMEAVCSE